MTVTLRSDIPTTPTFTSVARKIPVHWVDKANRMILELIEDNIIEPVTEPTTWCSPAFFVSKANLVDLRFVVDLSGLNRFILRAVHPFPSPTDIINVIPPGSTNFMTIDCLSGYFQIELSEEAQKLTTFLLPSGRYKFKRAPMGMSCSADEWNRRSDEALFSGGRIPGVMKIVDDILICASSLEELESKAIQVLSRLQKANIKVSKKKLRMGKSVPFAGFIVSESGVTPDPDNIICLQNVSPPKTQRQLKGFLGAIRQLQIFAPDLSHILRPLYDLTMKKNAFLWTDSQQQAFDKIKDLLKSDLKVTFFDSKKKSILLCDASKLFGIGHALCQQEEDGKLRLIQCASRSLTPTENNYSVTELEMLAIVYAFQKNDHFLRGCTNLEVWTDHRALPHIFENPIGKCPNTRLIRMRLKLSNYSFSCKYVKGCEHHMADMLSRKPYFKPDRSDIQFCNAINTEEDHPDSDPQLAEIKQKAADDASYQEIIRFLQSGKDPKSLKPDHPAWLLHKIFDDLSIEDGLICRNSQIIVPKSAENIVLKHLHSVCQGPDRIKTFARGRYYWSTMKADIDRFGANCKKCREFLQSQQRQELNFSNASRPFEELGLDCYDCCGKYYLIIVDRYSSYPWCHPLRGGTTRQVIDKLEEMFYQFSFIPTKIRSDGGKNFDSHEFKEFCAEWHIRREMSSADFQQSNGLAESGVKRIKKILEQNDGIYNKKVKKQIMDFRQTPPTDLGLSPVQMLYGFATRSSHPTHESFFKEVNRSEAVARKLRRQASAKKSWDKSCKNLSLLRINQKVSVQNFRTLRWDRTGTIKEVRPDDLSYKILLDDTDRAVLRNRKYLRPLAKNGTLKRVHFTDPLLVKLY